MNTMQAQGRAGDHWRRRLLRCMCMLALGMLFVAGTGCASQPPTATSGTPTPATTATREPTPTPTLEPMPTATTNPYVQRNRLQGCAPSAPPPAPQVVYKGTAPGWSGPPLREVALTFDDGPSPKWTPQILQYLEQTYTPATFFVIGEQAQLYPSLVQREWLDGFALGDHTWAHPDMTRLSVMAMRYQLSASFHAIHTVIGAQACLWFWRPPYGSYNAVLFGVAQSMGLTTVTWNVDPQDWSRPGTQVIAARVLAQVQPGSIILLHDGGGARGETLAALPVILAGLRARGLTPVTLPKLLADGHWPGVAEPPA